MSEHRFGRQDAQREAFHHLTALTVRRAGGSFGHGFRRLLHNTAAVGRYAKNKS